MICEDCKYYINTCTHRGMNPRYTEKRLDGSEDWCYGYEESNYNFRDDVMFRRKYNSKYSDF